MVGVSKGATFAQRWFGDPATYPLFLTIGAGILLLGVRCAHAMVPPEVVVSKKSRATWDRWTEKEAKDQAENFRNHSIRGFFKTVKPSIMPGLNEAMSK